MRNETIVREYYTFDELSDDAKQHAIESWRASECEHNNHWHEDTIEDFTLLLESIGFNNVEIHFRGFWSQGDGACFTGNYSYAPIKQAVKDWAFWPEFVEFAKALQAVNKRYFYGIEFQLYKFSHHYQHGNTVSITGLELSNSNEIKDYSSLEDDILGLCRSFMQDIYCKLEREWEYTISDEAIIETIKCNEYKFDNNGNMI
jgi:hypothetical protein